MTDVLTRPDDFLAMVSDKQLEVLDLLLQHMTNKDIARELDIAPVTVEQRIAAIRGKWGTADRNETARLYGQLIGVYGRPIHGSSGMDRSEPMAEQPLPGLPQSSEFHLSDIVIDRDAVEAMRLAEGPEALDERFGKVWRVAAIPLIAVLIGMVLIWGLAFADQLGDLL
jgi:DNA-binding CsgD family transcriptional regulator